MKMMSVRFVGVGGGGVWVRVCSHFFFNLLFECGWVFSIVFLVEWRQQRPRDGNLGRVFCYWFPLFSSPVGLSVFRRVIGFLRWRDYRPNLCICSLGCGKFCEMLPSFLRSSGRSVRVCVWTSVSSFFDKGGKGVLLRRGKAVKGS